MSNSFNKQSSANNANNNSIIKFPGLARQSNVDEKGKLLKMSSDSLSKADRKNNMNNSFEQFTASCEDAWDSKIEDKISLMNMDRNCVNSHNNRLKYGSKPSIHIKELVCYLS